MCLWRQTDTVACMRVYNCVIVFTCLCIFRCCMCTLRWSYMFLCIYCIFFTASLLHHFYFYQMCHICACFMGMEVTWQWCDVRSCVCAHEKVQQRQFSSLFCYCCTVFTLFNYLSYTKGVRLSLEFVCVSATRDFFLYKILFTVDSFQFVSRFYGLTR